MRRRAILVTALVAACAHPHRVTDETPPMDAPEAGTPASSQGKTVRHAPGRPPVPASPDALLTPGAITAVQKALAGRTQLGPHREGELDDATSRAIAEFQRAEGLAATGFPDRETLERLGVDPTTAYRRGAGGGGVGSGGGGSQRSAGGGARQDPGAGSR